MAPLTPRLKILSVGGNPVSAFLSWRLQASNACDVTLVWKTGFEHVSQYGISFKSADFGNERFKPRHVVRTPEEAASRREGAFDYVILCIKALPDIYDLASVIDAVVTPQHTCILVNTTHALGLESAIEERFPTNVVLSLVCGAELAQLSASEFEHKSSTQVWVGPANENPNIPRTIQEDMAQALAMTLNTGQVDCKVSPNIRQQQYERVIGPIAFHPLTVIFETPDYAALLEKVGVSKLVSDIIDELIALAEAQGCKFPPDFKQNIINEYSKSSAENIMWQDYMARRPMEVETYLGSPIRLSQDAKVSVPRVETLYAILHNLNLVNRNRPKIDTSVPAPAQPGSPAATPSPLPRMSAQGPPRQMPNGMPNGNGMPRSRPRGGSSMGPPGPGMRRPPPPTNGGPPNGYPRPGPNSRLPSRRGSMEGADLEEFSHLVLYDDIPEGGEAGYAAHDLALREKELQLRQKELALKEQEMRLRRAGQGMGPGPGPRRGPSAPPSRAGGGGFDDDDDDDDDYFDPHSTIGTPMIDPDNFDMMSVTSRKNRKVLGTNPVQFRKNPEQEVSSFRSRFRPSFGRNRSSQVMAAPPVNADIMDDPLLGFTSNRYGDVDRGAMHAAGSRANSLTAARLDELQYSHGPPPTGVNGGGPRRVSGNPYSPSIRGGVPGGRPSPPNGLPPQQQNGGRPSPPEGVQQPMPRYPPGHGNNVAPHQVEQHAGVSALQPPKSRSARSLTGSASASAGSGDSTNLDSEPSAHSSQTSLGPRPPIGVR
ncbi:2-dehydropantoate 2-reductase-like protein [Thermothelomyces thermophilus ATCC 42464]|uniref:2-dehydropantoate 2-reductase-like protein n=1 Tax=Thermothelomyces thermophilus (strain ATCC 42464 / BCRC 31852 / DSM 1799) TaxID=573729 RepID=G2Q0K8_THET4|nr:2-dehydropantoate 2-reductase-like protein [Thermothelomyces thermophilus ATCC 42464]AEO54870.1 2-dehydropantoate 2-reductase-like protein [Thermothelomyces thermophilus ATCC 42464]